MDSTAKTVAALLVQGSAAAYACEDPLDPGPVASEEMGPQEAILPSGGILAVSALSQAGVAGQPAPEDPTVRALARGGVPMSDIEVHFQVTSGNGDVSEELVMTDEGGYASAQWTLGETGLNRLRVWTPRASAVFFEATATAAAPDTAVATTLSVRPVNVTFVALGQMRRLRAVVLDQFGDTLNAPVAWRSTDTTVVSVNANGRLRALGNGVAHVIASAAPGLADTSRVTVQQTSAAVIVSPASDTVQVGGTTQLAAAAFDANGYPMPNQVFQWVSAHPALAAVTSAGLVTGLAAGVATITARADDVSGSASVRVEADAPPPGGGGNVVFHSDWSSALGSTLGALLDQTKAKPWTLRVGNGRGDEVVRSTGLDFPTSNAYHSVAQYRSGGVYAQQTRLGNGSLPVPAVGESLYYRWYFRVTVPDAIDPSGGTPHPIQDGTGASVTNWVFRFDVNQNGTWQPGFGFHQTSYPNNRFTLPVTLPKHQTFRFEFQLLRTGSATFEAHARIYDSSGQILYDDDDFRNMNGTGSVSLADRPVLVLGQLGMVDEFQAGNNGPSWANVPASAYPFSLWYTAGVAVCTQDWCGAHDPAAEN